MVHSVYLVIDAKACYSTAMSDSGKIRLDKLLIPVQRAVSMNGFFRWPGKVVLASVEAADSLPLGQLGDHLKRHLGVHCRISLNAIDSASVRIRRCQSIKGNEAYRINIHTDGIDIFASSDAGAYYAVQTLCGLVTIHGWVLPACRIEDWPVFARRGVYHDCSRGKVPKLSTLKQLVERLAHWKINEFQLYIENVFTFKHHPDIGKGYSPFTPAEILVLQDHCKKHHVRLVGSLASFGHLEKILMLPAYRHLGEMPGFRNLPGGTMLCPTDSGSIKLVKELYEEFVPLFEAEDFNACCDETWELGKGKSKKIADNIGTGRVYLDFILKIYHLCRKHGKRMNIWADILLKYPEMLGKLPRDIVLLNWEYEQDGVNIKRTREIAKAGFDFMVCPGTSSWLTHGSRLPNAMQNVRNFAQQGIQHGAKGLLMTDWGDQGHRNFLGVSLHGFAHAAAHAWNTNAVVDKTFTECFCQQVFSQPAKVLKILGSTYLTCGATAKNRSLLFNALTEPLAGVENSAIDKMKASGLKKVIKQLSAKTLWPKPACTLPEFEQIALEELKLAARMDCLAARRALVAKKLRKNIAVRSSELRCLADEMESIAGQFRKLWLKRNKPSRLRDNMKLFREIVKMFKV
jgi:hexosaminidase